MQKAEVRGQKAEAREQKAVGGCQRSEVRGQSRFYFPFSIFHLSFVIFRSLLVRGDSALAS